jgi:hypothetical protein
LADREAVLGSDHLATIKFLMDMGVTLANSGDPEGARERFADAHERAERSLGPDNRLTLKIAANLGIVLAETGELEWAMKMLGRAEAGFLRLNVPESKDFLKMVAEQINIRMELLQRTLKDETEA